MNKQEELFLSESNKIEGVYDYDSLQQAKYAWEFLKTVKEMTSGSVLKTHKILMLNQPLRPDEKGYFRKVPVWIGGRKGIHFSKITEQMRIWCENVNFRTEYEKDSHIAFEKIHPFVDGNGRLGRLLMNWQRIKTGKKVLIIFEKNKHEYYKWFS